MKTRAKTSQALLASISLAAACSLQGGLTDLGENEGEGGEPPSVSSKGGAKSPGSGGKVGQSSSGSASVPVSGSSAGGSRPIGGTSAGGSAPITGDGGDGFESPVGFASKKNQYGFAFEDSYFITSCLTVQQHDCLQSLGFCPMEGDEADWGDLFVESFQMDGIAGQTYLVTIAVRGIVDGKVFVGGARRAGADFEPDKLEGQDMLYIGGESQQPSNYRTYQLSVLEADGTTLVQNYFLNSVPDVTHERHKTYAIDYQVTLEVPGQGVIRYRNHDRNCHSINNCGPGEVTGDACPAPRSIPGEPNLAIPAQHGGRSVADMNVVNGAQQPYHAQIVHVRVLDVTLK